MAPSPGELLKEFVDRYVEDNEMSPCLKLEVPKKWEKYGDFVLFSGRSFSSEIWQKQNIEFWKNICDILKCKRLALKERIQSDGYRSPNVKILIGTDPWIMCIDNSIKYSWNVERNMFCAGNAHERHRVASLDCRNEVVTDMFAGIGYFVLPFLVHAKAEVVHACEWNPDAVTALKRNLKLNKVSDRCVIHEGDNQRVCPRGIANRVNLGLIPSSEGSWRVACEALKPTGGVLHVHGNVETMKDNETCVKCSSIKTQLSTDCLVSFRTDGTKLSKGGFTWKKRQWHTWAVHVVHTLASILRDVHPSKHWICSVENVHHVKSYAPHVDHLVLDVTVESVAKL